MAIPPNMQASRGPSITNVNQQFATPNLRPPVINEIVRQNPVIPYDGVRGPGRPDLTGGPRESDFILGLSKFAPNP